MLDITRIIGYNYDGSGATVCLSCDKTYNPEQDHDDIETITFTVDDFDEDSPLYCSLCLDPLLF